jgi:WD40 repeat protein
MKSILASASWDKTVRLWDMFDSWRTKETLALTSDGELCWAQQGEGGGIESSASPSSALLERSSSAVCV